MNFEHEQINGVFVIHPLNKKVTLAHSVEFKDLILKSIDAGNIKVVVDLTGIEFIDSTIIGVLVLGLKKISAANGEIRLFGLGKTIEDSFILTKLNTRFNIFKAKEEALANF